MWSNMEIVGTNVKIFNDEFGIIIDTAILSDHHGREEYYLIVSNTKGKLYKLILSDVTIV